MTLSALPGRTVVFAYPRTGEPGKIGLVDDWDMIPGARGCTPQTCAFRDLFAELKAAGASAGVRAVDAKQRLPDRDGVAAASAVPGIVGREAGADARARSADHGSGRADLIKRLALVIDDGRITHVFYPVFPPDRNAGDVLAWLKQNPV